MASRAVLFVQAFERRYILGTDQFFLIVWRPDFSIATQTGYKQGEGD
jgi:hypothetical protein